MKLTPREPTPSMVDAGQKAAHWTTDYVTRVIWRAMHDAAPSGWQPIETAPKDMGVHIVVVRWTENDGNESYAFDYTEDGCWMEWHNRAEHVAMIGGHGVSQEPPYEHWMPLPAPPSEKGE